MSEGVIFIQDGTENLEMLVAISVAREISTYDEHSETEEAAENEFTVHR